MSTYTSPSPLGFKEDLLQKLKTDHSPEQQLWLSGYLYGLASKGLTAKASSEAAADQQNSWKQDRISILFGSQTGNSKKAAHWIADRLKANNLDVSLTDLNDYEPRKLKDEKMVLLVLSTQGEGDPPIAAEALFQWLNSPRASALTGVRYAVCGLGDKSYLHFCKAGKDLDLRLEALGATRFAARADCDTDFEAPVADWVRQLEQNLLTLTQQRASTVIGASLAHEASKEKTAAYSRHHPFEALVVDKIQLNGRGSDKETWHVALSLEGSGLSFEPGDALGLFPENPRRLVEEILHAGQWNGAALAQFQGEERPLSDILTGLAEITSVNREVLEKYAHLVENRQLQDVLQGDVAKLKSFLWGRSLADLLHEFPAQLEPQALLAILPKLKPRLYSIASSPLAHPDEAHLTVGALRYAYQGRQRHGAASVYVADTTDIGHTLPVFIERNEYFKLPADDHTDIIMVGAGTGIAPFRAFVAERVERGAPGKNWLFFGNPHFETDFLYQTEWLQHLKKGGLDRLDVAFSRSQHPKIYVQHRLLERATLVFERLENGASLYVCGDKNRMAADVQAAVKQLIAQESGKGKDFAEEYVNALKKQRRYLEDVY